MRSLLSMMLAPAIALAAISPARALSTTEAIRYLSAVKIEDAQGVREACDALFETVMDLADQARKRPSYSRLVDELMQSKNRRYLVELIRVMREKDVDGLTSDRAIIDVTLGQLLKGVLAYSKRDLAKQYAEQAKCREDLYKALDVIQYDRSLPAQTKQTLHDLVNQKNAFYGFDYWIRLGAQKNWTASRLIKEVRDDISRMSKMSSREASRVFFSNPPPRDPSEAAEQWLRSN